MSDIGSGVAGSRGVSSSVIDGGGGGSEIT